jgi:GT2 family glycosyltransferase
VYERSQSADTTSRLFVGILTYNGLHHTVRCLDSLRTHTQAPWQALILDNASSDETPAYLRQLDDARIAVRCGDQNLGVSGGRNWLITKLLPQMRDTDCLVLLDNDIEVLEGWDAPFLEAFAAHPELGVAGRWAFSMRVHDSWRDILSEDSAASGPVDTVQGCCFWIRAAAAHAVGLFDETLGGFWHEDDDYCIRALAAGWDVRRVATDAIVHHEHGSGVALRPDKLFGSWRNQSYLANKWRSMHAVGLLGVPVRRVADEFQPVCDAMSQRLRRPILRTELNSAIRSAALLMHGTLDRDHAAALATPLARLILEDGASIESEAAQKAKAALACVSETVATRQASAPVSAASRAFSSVCTPDSWDDARWSDSFTQGFRNGSGIDYTSRTESTWRDGQLWHALRAMGALKRDASVLVVGQPFEPLIAALSYHVRELVLSDREPLSDEQVLGRAQQMLGNAQRTYVSWPLAQAAQYDLIVCPNVSRYARAGDVPGFLRTLAANAREGSIVAVGVSVRVSGPVDGTWVELETLANDHVLQSSNLRRVGGFNAAVSDEVLRAAVPDRLRASLRPGLARSIASHCVTMATLVAKRV